MHYIHSIATFASLQSQSIAVSSHRNHRWRKIGGDHGTENLRDPIYDNLWGYNGDISYRYHGDLFRISSTIWYQASRGFIVCPNMCLCDPYNSTITHHFLWLKWTCWVYPNWSQEHHWQEELGSERTTKQPSGIAMLGIWRIITDPGIPG